MNQIAKLRASFHKRSKSDPILESICSEESLQEIPPKFGDEHNDNNGLKKSQTEPHRVGWKKTLRRSLQKDWNGAKDDGKYILDEISKIKEIRKISLPEQNLRAINNALIIKEPDLDEKVEDNLAFCFYDLPANGTNTASTLSNASSFVENDFPVLKPFSVNPNETPLLSVNFPLSNHSSLEPVSDQNAKIGWVLFDNETPQTQEPEIYNEVLTHNLSGNTEMGSDFGNFNTKKTSKVISAMKDLSGKLKQQIQKPGSYQSFNEMDFLDSNEFGTVYVDLNHITPSHSKTFSAPVSPAPTRVTTSAHIRN